VGNLRLALKDNPLIALIHSISEAVLLFSGEWKTQPHMPCLMIFQ
jgi:hypothetical protein